MKKYKTAIVGCGGIGHAHMEGYEKIDEIDVVACCDTVHSAVEDYKKEFNIPNGYTDIEEMLEKSQPEIVSVCVWHLLHDEITIKLSESPHVKGIICEKPMAIGIDKANSMVEACKKNDTKLVVSHQRRFTPGWIKAKEIVERKLSVRDVERSTSKYKQIRKKPTQKDPNILDLEKELSDKIGLKTSIHFNENGSSGSLTLFYSDLNQLDDVMKRLKK